MLKGQSEIRMIWLMILIIIAVGTWFLEVKVLTYICGLAFVVSVMHYVDAIQTPMQDMTQQVQVKFQLSSKVPLYISSLVTIVGMSLDWHWLVGLGLSTWVFFFLRWLRRLERYLFCIEFQLQQLKSSESLDSPLSLKNTKPQNAFNQSSFAQTSTDSLGLMDQLKQWLLQGNPVLKTAILLLVIGIILLLRFATEHWQFSLALKLSIVAIVSAAITILGYLLQHKNRSFTVALEGLGLAGLFLTLFFAYYNHVIPYFWIASLSFAVIMSITLWLSLKQQSIELALMAMLIAAIAPFTLPIRAISTIELVSYYLVINTSVAILTTLRPWKILNQIAFIMTVSVAGGYAFIHGYGQQRPLLTGLLFAHTAIFIWLSFRFSQLIAKQDLEQFKLKPALDIALIFGAPIISYIFLYLMYFNDRAWQAGLSCAFAMLYAVLYQTVKRNQAIQFISNSYLSLMLIFIVLIPPILLHEQWSVVGWAIEGLIIFIYALYRDSAISRYLAMALLLVAGLFSLYYLAELTEFPRVMYWILSLSYFAVVIMSNSREAFQKQLNTSIVIFFSALMLAATSMLLILLLDHLKGSNQYIFTLLIATLAYVIMNEWLLFRKALWPWLLPKWVGLIPLYVLILIILIDRSQNGAIVWQSIFERWGIAGSGLLLVMLWLRPMTAVGLEKEVVSLGVLLSLALMSLSLVPSMPYISIVILPLVFCGWCVLDKHSHDWSIFWQTRSSLALVMLWMVCSQLFSQHIFQGYLFPILNPFDLVSIAILVVFCWMLSLQLKGGMDKGIIAVLSVLSLLWLSSYVLLRALHHYFSTPYNELALWQNAVVQLSFTLLWVSLAFISMSWASHKQLRAMWILGGSILVIVTLKLVLFDLSHIGTLTRVISFLGAGFVMLVIAYVAPIPEPNHLEPKHTK
ncbi:DUF2339 domain-containing protein [Acinetobacter sp. ANC 4648]|uniref:DUF2339 domain-containing protein n=1 Tax=Acinetobacter sp. ANC 4648 TaxID=1977875 RepID=UPI000A32F2B6|nr:DUF2339 domain-containing protein [Acinetobacter sp. ANC 4648]OTG85222.1 hypothetical protein B9T27_00045 [Acinetobacter sp. ANC 4648]